MREQAKPIQQNLLTKCEELPTHDGTTGSEILQTMILWATQYNECSETHNALVDVITKDF